jgi:hypothetical protein
MIYKETMQRIRHRSQSSLGVRYDEVKRLRPKKRTMS